MLVFWKFTNAEDGSLSYTWQDEANDDFNNVAPLTEIDITIDERIVTDRYRMQQHAVNPTFAYHGGMHIDITGDLFRDTPADYVTERKAMLLALRGAPDVIPTHRKAGTLSVEWSGDTESASVDVQIEQISLPIAGLSPSHTQYMITFFAPLPWFEGDDTADLYYFS